MHGGHQHILALHARWPFVSAQPPCLTYFTRNGYAPVRMLAHGTTLHQFKPLSPIELSRGACRCCQSGMGHKAYMRTTTHAHPAASVADSSSGKGDERVILHFLWQRHAREKRKVGDCRNGKRRKIASRLATKSDLPTLQITIPVKQDQLP